MKNPLWKLPGFGRLIAVTIASVCLFLAQLVMSHLTHSITLLVSAYHMLYNIMSLFGCIATIKARLEVVSMIVNLLFVSALYFSTGVEAVQTLIHSGHTDSMHQPDIICILAGIGLVLNVVCIMLIGGYTHHQGSFLALTPHGDVFIQHDAASEEAVRLGLRRLATTTERSRSLDCGTIQQFSIEEAEKSTDENLGLKANNIRMSQKCPTLGSIFRDISSSLFVLISGLVVFFYGESFTSLIIDPIVAIVSMVIFILTSYPFMKQAGQILLQTTPSHIDVEELEAKLKKAFPSLVQIHDFHVWALTPERVIATAHLLFMNEQVYLRIKDSINDFFLSHGITRATLQPEFYKFGNLSPAPSKGCILSCNEESCTTMTCCNQKPVAKQADDVESHSHSHNCGDHHSPVLSEMHDVAVLADATDVTNINLLSAATSISLIKEENQMLAISGLVECKEPTCNLNCKDDQIIENEEDKTQSSRELENSEVALPLLS